METLDETDMDILELLIADARRPYSEIADRVGVSPPTVSDRVERLVDLGVVERFTLDVDRTAIADGLPVLVDLETDPRARDEIIARLSSSPSFEHVYGTADCRVVAVGIVEDGAVGRLLDRTIDLALVDDYEVRVRTETVWTPSLAPDRSGDEDEEAGTGPAGGADRGVSVESVE